MAITEDVYYEGGPHPGDLIVGILFGLTLVGLPVLIGSVVRKLWLRFRITSRRIAVTGGWMGQTRTEVIYSEISAVNSVPRGLGAWGDIALFLKDGSRLEMRSVPNFRETVAYIKEHMDAASAAKAGKTDAKAA